MRLFPLACLLALPLATPAQAQSTAFARLDADGNGQISRAEWQALRARMFAMIDADASGTLTQAEIAAARDALPADRRPAADSRIWTQDANGDGALTLAEYTATTRGFDRADRNADGALSETEFSRIARLLPRTQP